MVWVNPLWLESIWKAFNFGKWAPIKAFEFKILGSFVIVTPRHRSCMHYVWTCEGSSPCHLAPMHTAPSTPGLEPTFSKHESPVTSISRILASASTLENQMTSSPCGGLGIVVWENMGQRLTHLMRPCKPLKPSLTAFGWHPQNLQDCMKPEWLLWNPCDAPSINS